MSAFDVTISIIRIGSVAVLAYTFAFWSWVAIKKYRSKPVSTAVSFRYGDDFQGNIEFPVVSFCHLINPNDHYGVVVKRYRIIAFASLINLQFMSFLKKMC